MTRTARIAFMTLLPIALAFPSVGVAVAQDQPSETSEHDLAERAFLNAYYLEIGQQQHVRALAAYRRLLEEHPDAAIIARVWLGVARTLQALGRNDEARSALDHVQRVFAADEETTMAAIALRKSLATEADDDLGALVRAALQEDAWETRVPSFGNRAVPVLAELLRAADPSLVYRAAKSLLRIRTDDACDALLESLTADDILYPQSITQSALAHGPYPERLGAGVLRLTDTRLRDALIAQAINDPSADHQAWLLEVVLREAWAREIAFPPEPVDRSGTAPLIVAAITTGPGPARAAALAHLRLYEPRKRGRGRERGTMLEYVGRFFNPPPEFLQDREALRAAAQHVYASDGKSDPSEALRDALLADPETRDLALAWTWRDRMACTDRELFIQAVAASSEAGPAANILVTLQVSLAPRPSGAEWRLLLRRSDFSGEFVEQLLQLFANDDRLPTDTLDAFVDAGHAEHVLAWFERRPLPDAEWATRALPPLMRSKNPQVAVAAGKLLARCHTFDVLDASAHTHDFVELLRRHDGIWSPNIVLRTLLDKMGEPGVAAVVDATPLRNRGDEQILDHLLRAERSQASEVARRLLLGPVERSDHRSLKLLEKAVYTLAVQQGDASVPILLEAVRLEPIERGAVVARQTWQRSELTSAALEAFSSALIDDCPVGVTFPVNTGRLETSAVRRLALRALASDDIALQRWGAERQQSLLDPLAAERLGELAESPAPDVRRAARHGLAEMRKADQDMEWMRIVAGRRATRARVDAYLASENANERMAGVAGLVALHATDGLERLLDVAAKDADTDVRAEARRALLALGDRRGDGPVESKAE